MNKEVINDERVVLQRRKIQSDAYQILICCLLASILIQQFLMNAPFSQIAAEFFCVIAMGIYITLRHLTAGIDIWKRDSSDWKKLMAGSIISGTVCTALMVFIAGIKRVDTLCTFFLCYSAFYFLAHFTIRRLSGRRLRQIEEEMDKEEFDNADLNK